METNVSFESISYSLCACRFYTSLNIFHSNRIKCGPGNSVGIATVYGLDGPGIESRWGRDFFARRDRPWGPPSLLYNGYPFLHGGKVRPERAADHSPPSSAEVYTSTPLWPTTGPVTGLLYLYQYRIK